ncbi:MAG: hypothetical protein V4714_11380 [Bacteroidota bacterium]
MLKETVEKLYEQFSTYKAVRPLDICTYCCMSIENEELLASLLVREIPKDLLAEYNDGASTAKTPIDELKHFLPRYLELISQFEFPTHSAEIALRRLTPYDETEWSEQELKLLRQFSLDYFEYCLAVYPLPEYIQIDSVIIMLWHSQFEIKDLLLLWETDKSKESILHYKDLMFYGFKQHNPSKLNNPFGGKPIYDFLRQWLDKEEVIKHFSGAIEEIILQEESLEEPDLDELNLLYEILASKKNIH